MRPVLRLAVTLSLAACIHAPAPPPSPPVAPQPAVAACVSPDPRGLCAVRDDDVPWRCDDPARCCPAQPHHGSLEFSVVSATEPAGELAHMLSGLTWDGPSRRFLAVRDNDPAVVALTPDEGFTHFTFSTTPWAVAPFSSLEGLAVWQGGLVVSHEDDRFGAGLFMAGASPGQGTRALPLPATLGAMCDNSGVEAIAASPDGSTLTVAMERAHPGDPAGVVRVVQLDANLREVRSRVWRLGPDCWCDGQRSDPGVAEMVALSNDHVLVLERTFRREGGNCIRLFLGDLSQGDGINPRERVDASVRAVPKRLVLDLSTLPRDTAIPTSAGQRHPLLGNYEGMALGPCLPDGRRALVMVTDDNEDSVRRWSLPPQSRRVLVLGAAGL